MNDYYDDLPNREGECMSARTDAAYHDLGRAPHTTLCWHCSAEYAADAIRCPQCRAANANINLGLAIAQMEAQCPDRPTRAEE